MARPAPRVIDSVELEYYTLDILESEGYWTVFYQGEPVALRQKYYTSEGMKMKYPRNGFNNQAHCENLANKLNEHFNCLDFTCEQLVAFEDNQN